MVLKRRPDKIPATPEYGIRNSLVFTPPKWKSKRRQELKAETSEQGGRNEDRQRKTGQMQPVGETRGRLLKKVRPGEGRVCRLTEMMNDKRGYGVKGKVAVVLLVFTLMQGRLKIMNPEKVRKTNLIAALPGFLQVQLVMMPHVDQAGQLAEICPWKQTSQKHITGQ